MVAFIEKLPGMTPQEYRAIVAKAPPDEDMDNGGGHNHGHHPGDGSDEDSGGAAAMQGMGSPDEAGHSHADATEGLEHAGAAPAADSALSFQGLQPKAVPAAEAVARAFQSALQHGDRAVVLALLAPDASVSEGGLVQTRDEYASGHLDDDIAFLKDARITPVSIASMPLGDSAMVGSESEISTSVKGKSVTLRSREILKIKRDGKNWKIVSVQWQSTPETAE
jgi:ketosteroid isomerase-like protein